MARATTSLTATSGVDSLRTARQSATKVSMSNMTISFSAPARSRHRCPGTLRGSESCVHCIISTIVHAQKVYAMDLRHLRYFIAVAEAGGFSKAAARLRVSQPALWRQVRQLERDLGVRLFD